MCLRTSIVWKSLQTVFFAGILTCTLALPAFPQMGAAPGPGAVSAGSPTGSSSPVQAAPQVVGPQIVSPQSQIGGPQGQQGAQQSGPQNQAGSQGQAKGAEQSQKAQQTEDQGEKGSKLQTVPPAYRMNDFQNFVSESLGRPVPIFGMELFESSPSTFAPLDHVPVPNDYVIGPEDELIVHLWGQVDANLDVVVDRTGAIFIPRVGQVQVSGVRFADLPQKISQSISRIYRNFNIDIQMGQLRSIQVLVLGNAGRPGMYTVSSLSTLINALFASGGPSGNGSMRRIELRRGNKVVTKFDLYDLLVSGDKSKDTKLQPGDVIFIPTIGQLVAVSAGVRNPAIYELNGETTLAELINMAGGFTTTAYRKTATFERLSLGSAREVQHVALDEPGLTTQLRDGDVIQISAISPRFENAVTLRGNVARAGRYPWRSGMRVKDLIPTLDYLISPEHWTRVNGAIGRQTGSSIREDVVAQSVGVNWDYALIERIDPKTLTTKLVSFNLAKALIQGDPKDNLDLEPGDIVTIFGENDILLPEEKRSVFVTLSGEFAVPGVYKIEPGETLRQLVIRVGGFTSGAYLRGCVFTRESIRQSQQQSLEKFITDLKMNLERTTAAQAGNDVNPSDIALSRQRQQMQQRLIDNLSQTRATGRLVLELTEYNPDPNLLPDLALRDGDTFMVPPQPSNVSVVGLVYNSGDFIYKNRLRVKDYLRQAGGPTRYADSSHMYILRANGSVINAQSGHFSLSQALLYPGDAVIMPEHFETGGFLRGLKDWSQVFANFGLAATPIALVLTQ
jgi:polysaccharide biosynthesis/export protein